MPSLKRSLRKGGFMGIFMLGIVVVTTRGRGTGSMVIALLETIPLIFLFVAFDLWMARKVYKRVTGREAPRPEKTPRDEKRAPSGRGRGRGSAEAEEEEGPSPTPSPAPIPTQTRTPWPENATSATVEDRRARRFELSGRR